MSLYERTEILKLLVDSEGRQTTEERSNEIEKNQNELFIQLKKIKNDSSLNHLYEVSCKITTRIRHETGLSPLIRIEKKLEKEKESQVIISWLKEGPICKIIENESVFVEYEKNEVNYSGTNFSHHQLCVQIIEWLNFELLHQGAHVNRLVSMQEESNKEKEAEPNKMKTFLHQSYNYEGLNSEENNNNSKDNVFVNFTFH